MDRDPAAAGRRQGDDVVAAPVHGGDAGVRQAERIGPASQGDRVGQLVADQRLDPADQAGQQHLLPRDAGWHRTVPVVHDLEHHQVLQNVHASLAWAAGRGDQRLGGPVEVDRLQPPGVGHALAHVGRLHLRAGADHRRRDPQPALELLLGQRGRHRWVGGQGLGLEGVQGGHHLGQRGGHGQPRGGAGLPGQQHGVHLVGDVARAGGADPGQPGRRPQTPAGQAPQAGPDPDGELVDVLHEQPAYPGGPGGGEHLVPPQVRPVGGGRGQVRLQVRPSKPEVGDDPVEVVHHRRLGQRRQLPQRHVAGGRVRPEHLPVVGRGGHGVGDQGPQSLALELEQPVARPAVPGQLVTGQGPEPVRRAGRGRGRGGRGHGSLPSPGAPVPGRALIRPIT